jgi:phosphohistidine phosphatase
VLHIGHSGKLRSRETAEIVAGRLSSFAALEQLDELAPMADPDEARVRAETLSEPSLWVGHLPHLGRLVSALLLGSAVPELVRWEPAAVACLLRERAAWRLLWLLAPELLRQSD